jgi:CDGSH-type Zn-finger protein
MAQKPVIEIETDGPYLVKGLSRLEKPSGEALPAEPVMALCRCGDSGNKPFCDGTHAVNDFSGRNQADQAKDRRKDYAGKGVTIHDNRSLCAHAAHCTERLPAVYRQKQRPWIDPDGAEVQAVVESVRACPSGALSYSLGGAEHRDQERGPAIRLERDGPYQVTGSVDLRGELRWGEGASREHYTLCRCGASRNKPFCDGSHWSKPFKDEKNR